MEVILDGGKSSIISIRIRVSWKQEHTGNLKAGLDSKNKISFSFLVKFVLKTSSLIMICNKRGIYEAFHNQESAT